MAHPNNPQIQIYKDFGNGSLEEAFPGALMRDLFKVNVSSNDFVVGFLRNQGEAVEKPFAYTLQSLEIKYIVSGTLSYEQDGRRGDAPAGSVVLLPKDAFITILPCNFDAVYLSARGMQYGHPQQISASL